MAAPFGGRLFECKCLKFPVITAVQRPKKFPLKLHAPCHKSSITSLTQIFQDEVQVLEFHCLVGSFSL